LKEQTLTSSTATIVD